MYEEITLSNTPVTVRRLGLFELDRLSRPKIGPFTYTIKLVTGGEAEVPFYLEDYPTPPQPPDQDEREIEEKSEAWYQLLVWQRYQAALHHEWLRLEETADYLNAIAQYIIENCITPEAARLIQTEEDWSRVFQAAYSLGVTLDHIQAALRDTFQASWRDQDIFEALDAVAGGNGKYDAIRKWEVELMNHLHMTEAEYTILDVTDRARRICALKLDDWLETLEADWSEKTRAK